DEEGRLPAALAEQRSLLWMLVERLHGDLSALPSRAAWGEYADTVTRLLVRYFDPPPSDGVVPSDRDGCVRAAIGGCLSSIAKLDVLGEEVSLKEWTDLFIRALERARVPADTADRHGVQVLDAMDARGIPFRALF